MTSGLPPPGRLHFAFRDAELEDEFLSESTEDSLGIVRSGLVLALVLYAAFGLLDRWMLPDSHRTVWLIRFAVVVPFVGAVLLASFHPRFPKVQVPVVLLAALILGGGILAMIQVSAPGEPGYQSYYTGLILVIVWIGTFSQLRFWHATFAVVAVLAGYVVVTGGGTDGPGPGNGAFLLALNNGFFLIGAAILGVFSAYAFERSKRVRFLQTREIAREKAKTETLLGRIETLFGQQVSEEVAKELVRGPAETESRLSQVTVMFLDIRDFTAFADRREPAEVAAFQNAVFGEVIETVRAHRGVINQILGDGVMATFGAPIPNERHVDDAVSAGFEVLRRIEDLSSEGRIPPIRVGIGLHTGRVLAGNIGNEFRKQYSLTGTTVNIAARIEQLNKPHDSRFLVSEAVLDGMLEPCPSTSLGEVALKGVARPVEVHRLA